MELEEKKKSEMKLQVIRNLKEYLMSKRKSEKMKNELDVNKLSTEDSLKKKSDCKLFKQ